MLRSRCCLSFSRCWRCLPQSGAPVTVSVEVEHTGGKDGEEVVELYLKAAGIRSLEGFHRIPLKSKEKRTVQFTLQPRQFSGPGPFEISAGGKQPGVLAGNLRTGR
jgi:beta-glucosidase